MNRSAPAIASPFPEASAQLTIAAITAMYATSGPTSDRSPSRVAARRKRAPSRPATTATGIATRRIVVTAAPSRVNPTT
jgi:hypothetical protein